MISPAPAAAAGALLNMDPFPHLYVHLPFCRHKCGYCDFNAYARLDGLMQPYVDALERELGYAAGRYSFKPLATVYFGGGTPSLMRTGKRRSGRLTKLPATADHDHTRRWSFMYFKSNLWIASVGSDGDRDSL